MTDITPEVPSERSGYPPYSTVPYSTVPYSTAPYSTGGPEAFPTAPPRIATMAILALIFGILLPPVGIVLGHIALSKIKTSGEGGRGMARAGLIVGYVSTLLAIIGVVLFFVLMRFLLGAIFSEMYV
ncbi:hypothetical protein M2390_002790 [Mycetocola sp. BIGb0189]|uniref:DUF4190 domain-containing protein n=1 Tax=Mycetocola sp. BIGb0189 TaxID=2940604 RepID=UPI0021677F31|nr:DUF4190 domain-containing protein [Mycetocola sp. BIGb0189]MCS4277581.1 hypothetical protein [Mycetocola sp. BIGb0189]